MVDNINKLEVARIKRLKEMVRSAKAFTDSRTETRKYHSLIYDRQDTGGVDMQRIAGQVNNEKLRVASIDATENESKYKTPFPRSFINKKVSSVVNLFFDGEGNLFKGTSTNLYSADKVKAVTKVLNKQIRNISFPKTLLQVGKSSFIEDIGILQVKWRYDSLDMNIFKEIQYLESLKENERDQRVLDEIEGAIDAELQKLTPAMMDMKHPSEFNGIDIEIIDPKDFYIDPNMKAGDMDQQADFVYVKKKVRLSKLMALSKLGRITPEALEKVKAERKYTGSNSQEKGKFGYEPDHDPNIELYEIWEKGLVTLITCDDILLDYRRDIYFGLLAYPFVVFINNPSYKGFFGDGDYKGIEPITEATDRMQTGMVNHYEQHLKGRTFVPPAWQSDSVLISRLQRGDAGVFAVPTMNGFKEDRIPLFDNSLVSAQAMFTNQIQASLSVDSLTATGNVGSNFRTDSTLNSYMQSAQSEMTFTITMFKENLKRLGRIMLALNSIFLTEPEKIILTDGDAEELPVYNSDIPLNLQLDLHISKFLDPEEQAKLARMEALLKMGAELGFVRVDKMFIEILIKSGLYSKDTDLIDFNFMEIMRKETETANAAGKKQANPAIVGQKALSYGQQQRQPQQPGNANQQQPGAGQPQAQTGSDQAVPM